jgi:drug/metabolite transporter (DMT)-like permease
MFQLSDALLGAGLATLASFMFAVQYLFVRLGTREGSVTHVIWVTLLCNVVVLVPATLLFYDFAMSMRALLAFAAAGVTGSILGRIFIFTSIERLGASRTSPIVASNALFATLLAVVFLDESLTLIHFLGVVLIVAGVAVISYRTAESTALDATRRELALLFVVPLLAAVCLGVEPIFLSVGYAAGGNVVPGTAVVVSTAFVGFTVYARTVSTLPAPSVVNEPYAKWLLGAGVATTIGLLAAFSAVRTAPVVIAVPLIQTSPLLVMLLSALFLSSKLEEVTPEVVASTVVIIVGATVVSLSG